MMFKQKMLSWSVASALMVMSGAASASGFALIEQSASGLGNAFAGGAASADDASTVFFNPAGMSRIDGIDTRLEKFITHEARKIFDPFLVRRRPT